MIKINDLSLEKKIPEISQLNLEIKDGEVYVLLSSDDKPVYHLLNIFSGVEKRFKGSIIIDGMEMKTHWAEYRRQVVYLSCTHRWPLDMKARDLVTFFKRTEDISEDEFEELYVKLNMEKIFPQRISELEETAWRNILFALTRLKKCPNYIIHEFAQGMPLDFNLEFKKNLQQLRKKGDSILYLSRDVFVAPEIGDRIGFMKKGKLLLELNASHMRKMNLKELYFQFMVDD